MARLVNRFTESVVNVPDEKVAGLLARGFEVKDDEATKTPAKKATSRKTSD